MILQTPANIIQTEPVIPDPLPAEEGAVPVAVPLKVVPQAIIDEKTAILESAFNHIYKERMVDIPILNDKIKVAAIGFLQWHDSYLCIMITPWFMNLMLLPGEKENWEDKRETTALRHTFPSGNYEFLVGFEPDIGKYQMCSLFSPMFEFADNDAAVETAEAAIKELMKLENIEETDIDSTQIQAIWDGTEEHPDKIAAREAAEKAKAEAPRIPLEERMQQPVSRRRLLRGALMMDDDKEKMTKVQTKAAAGTAATRTTAKNSKIAANSQNRK